MSIRDWPEHDRPREKLLKAGAAALSETELLAILLGAGVRGRSALDVARDLLADFGSLRAFLTADRLKVCKTRGVGPTRYVVLQAALELTRRHYQELMTVGSALQNPRATREFVQLRLRDLPYEVFCCLLLDSRYRVVGFEELFRGTIDGAIVHPREVLRLALSRNAAAVILVHNHPYLHNLLIINGLFFSKAVQYPLGYPHVDWKLPSCLSADRRYLRARLGLGLSAEPASFLWLLRLLSPA